MRTSPLSGLWATGKHDVDANTNALVARSQEEADSRARDELIARFLPLARKLASRYANPHEPLEDLVQVASVGLVQAIDRFDPGRGVRFQAFAVPTILGELKRHFRNTAWSAHVPRAAQEMALFEQALRISVAWGRFEQALDTGGEAARFAPVRRRHRGPLGIYRNIGRPLDLIVSDVSVLARGAVRALRLDDSIPPQLPFALEAGGKPGEPENRSDRAGGKRRRDAHEADCRADQRTGGDARRDRSFACGNGQPGISAPLATALIE
jgi:RNA polymerase sigma factor (sigma-70 family)